jgi:hypothetical protein
MRHAQAQFLSQSVIPSPWYADSTERLASPQFDSAKGAIMFMLSVGKFSKNLAATSKFEVPEWWHKISSTCWPTNIKRLPTQLSSRRRGARDLCILIYLSWYVECLGRRKPCSTDPAMPAIYSANCCTLLNVSKRSFTWISKFVPSLPRLALLSFFFFISSFSYFSPLLSRLQPLFRVRFLTDDITISVGLPAVLPRAVNCRSVAILGSLFPSNPY